MVKRGTGQGSIFPERRNGRRTGRLRVQVSYYDERGKLRKITRTVEYQGSADKTQREAAKIRRQLVATIGQNSTGVANEYSTLGEFLDYWLATVRPSQVRASTLQADRWRINGVIKPAIGEVPLTRLSPPHVRKLLATIADRSGNYRRLVYNTLAKALDTAVQDLLIAENPARAVERPSAMPKRHRTFTADEWHEIDNVARFESEYYAVYILARWCGMRRGEILALDLDDVEFDTGVIHVRKTLYQVDGELVLNPPKTEASRRSFVAPGTVMQILRDHVETIVARGRKTRLLFSSERGTPLHPGNFIRRDWHRVLDIAGVERRPFHYLRHTFATEALNAGLELGLVAKMMGDDPATVMKTYKHNPFSAQVDFARQIDAQMSRFGT